MADRLQGFTEGMRAHNIVLPPYWLTRAELTMQGGLAAARALLEPWPEPPEAIFALSDIMAIGLLHGLHDAGLEIPADVSVVGYDDIEMAAHTFPPLTTVRQPAAEIGAAAARAVIGFLDAATPLPKRVTLKPELVLRQSVRDGAPRP